jgi:hypothetical protein
MAAEKKGKEVEEKSVPLPPACLVVRRTQCYSAEYGRGKRFYMRKNNQVSLFRLPLFPLGPPVEWQREGSLNAFTHLSSISRAQAK